jgi:hypothetical protein
VKCSSGFSLERSLFVEVRTALIAAGTAGGNTG